MSAAGTKRTCRLRCAMSALGGKAENICSHGAFPILTHLRHWPTILLLCSTGVALNVIASAHVESVQEGKPP